VTVSVLRSAQNERETDLSCQLTGAATLRVTPPAQHQINSQHNAFSATISYKMKHHSAAR